MFNLDALQLIRDGELERLTRFLPPGKRVLEVGAGTGWQARELERRGWRVTAIDLPSSQYRDAQVFPVLRYDGTNLPFADGSFDCIFSSNVLEHVRDLGSLLREFRRVLAPGGVCVHAMPTPAWRAWSWVSALADIVPMLFVELLRGPRRPIRQRLGAVWRGVGDRLCPKAHGARGVGLTELWTFGSWWWRRVFARHGHSVIRVEPVGLFYTAWFLLGRRFSVASRERASALLGSACRVYVTSPADAQTSS